MKNILLTGSGGFIGKHLKTSLPSEHLFTPRSVELNLLDATTVSRYLKDNHIDFIIHGAACGVRITPDATMDEVARPNLQMFQNLAQSRIPMITIGSGAEYDKRLNLHKVTEDDFGKSVPQDPYGYAKYLISEQISRFDHIVNLRLFGVYGLGEHPSRMTSYLLQQIVNRQPIRLRQNVVFDFLYIADFCRIVAHFIAQFPTDKFFNVTPTQSISTLDLAKLAVQELGVNLPVSAEIPGLNKEYTGSNARLLSYLPGFRFTSYQEGIKAFYQQYTRAQVCNKN